MANNIFDDIYDNKLLFEKKKIFVEESKALSDQIREAVKQETIKEFSDEDLERLLAKARANPTKLFTSEEAEIINTKLAQAKKDAKALLKQIAKTKENFYDKVSKSSDKYELDISKSSILKRSSNRIFGGNKKKITYEDYVTLLEMKKQIQINESIDLVIGEDTDGNIQKA